MRDHRSQTKSQSTEYKPHTTMTIAWLLNCTNAITLDMGSKSRNSATHKTFFPLKTFKSSNVWWEHVSCDQELFQCYLRSDLISSRGSNLKTPLTQSYGLMLKCFLWSLIILRTPCKFWDPQDEEDST